MSTTRLCLAMARLTEDVQKTGTPSSTSASAQSITVITSSRSTVLLYILRKDLRVSDNPILHHISKVQDHKFNYLIPVYILAPHQIEVSGFIPEDSPGNCPYPEARSREGRFWRCGPQRAKFIAESVWTVKKYLETLGSGLVIRIGHYGEEIRRVAQQLQGQGLSVGAVWMTAEEGTEEKEDEKKIMEVCKEIGAEVRFWTDEKFFIDE